MPNFIKIAEIKDVPVGEGRCVDANGRILALFNVAGTFYAIDNTCLHREGPLGEGSLEGSVVTCPWHGWQYDVTTGISPVNPSVCVATFPVKIEGEEIFVTL